MSVSGDYLQFVLDQLRGWGGVSSRRMFGGAGLYRDGKMFGLIADDVAYLKVDDSNRADFQAYDVGPFKPYPDKDTVMSFYEVPPDILDDPEALITWARTSLEIQKTELNHERCT